MTSKLDHPRAIKISIKILFYLCSKTAKPNLRQGTFHPQHNVLCGPCLFILESSFRKPLLVSTRTTDASTARSIFYFLALLNLPHAEPRGCGICLPECLQRRLALNRWNFINTWRSLRIFNFVLILEVVNGRTVYYWLQVGTGVTLHRYFVPPCVILCLLMVCWAFVFFCFGQIFAFNALSPTRWAFPSVFQQYREKKCP